MSPVLEKINRLGHWETAIYPADYLHDRVKYDQLEATVRNSVVRLRGWPVPYVDYEHDILRSQQWIGQDVNAAPTHCEAWRFFASGQFQHRRVFSADMVQLHNEQQAPRQNSPSIEVWEILYYLTEVFELAARLALTSAGSEHMTVRTRLLNLNGRSLVMGYRDRTDFALPKAGPRDDLQFESSMARDDLVSRPGEHAAIMAQHFFGRFGWNPQLFQLTVLQSQLSFI